MDILYENLILMNGPPFVGIDDYCEKELSTKYETVIPSKIFSKDRSVGLRDVGLSIISLIQKDKRVAVLDGNELRKVRGSYIKLVQKKCTDCQVRVINVLPKYGCMQLFWAREHKLAEMVQDSKMDVKMADLQILKWFEKESDLDISYRLGIVDAVKETEGCTLQTHVVGLTAKCNFKWEVPALLIQWELLMNLDEGDKKLACVTDILRKWTEISPCGRIIVICDGSQISTGEKTKQQEKSEIKETFKQLCVKFAECVVYVYHIEDPHQAGGFVQPPKPGILAFLQRRHCLNLHSKRTVYLYETAEHMKLAENGGIRHLKGSKVMKNPSLVNSQSAATIPAIPEMLKTIELRPNDEDTSGCPNIPLYEKEASYHDNMVCQHDGKGRTEYAFVNDWSIFQKQQECYVRQASKLGESGSKMSPEKSVQSTGSFSVNSGLNQSKLSTSSRDLPKWMIGKEGSKNSISSLEKSMSGGSGDLENKARKTAYMMTDQELVDTALNILKQAGKTDIINKFQAKLLNVGEKEQKRGKEKPSFKNKGKQDQGRITDIPLEESLSSLCPKMEVESGDEYAPPKKRQTVIKGNVEDLIEYTGTSSKKRRPVIKDNVEDLNEYTGTSPKKRRPVIKDNVEDQNEYTGTSPKKRRPVKDSVKDMNDSMESEESLDCASTESSQGENDSIELESEEEEDSNDLKGTDKRRPNNLSGYSTSGAERLGLSNSGVKRSVRGEHDYVEAAKSDRIPSNESRTTEPSPGKRSRKHRTPDLSILDEIFN